MTTRVDAKSQASIDFGDLGSSVLYNLDGNSDEVEGVTNFQLFNDERRKGIKVYKTFEV